MKPGDKIYFLSDYNIIPCEVISVGKKNIKIKVPPHKGCIEHTKYVKPEKVILASEKFCVVWDTTKNVNGRGSYRIETEKYPDKHQFGNYWANTSNFIEENEQN